MPTLHRVTVFVDWDTARRVVRPALGRSGVRQIEQVFLQLQNAIATYLSTVGEDQARYRVHWRIYHGWYRGKTKTIDRKELETYAVEARSRTVGSVSFGTDYGFSDTLVCNSLRNPLFDTLRSDQTGMVKQKMVDTALICDLLQLARSRDSHLYIVVANDDDLLPGIFTAEAWKAKVVLLHTREATNQFLRLDGIATRLELT